MRVAVTGAGGFIGRHVVAELRRRGIEPVQVTRTQPHAGSADTPQVVLDITAPPPDAYERLGRPELLLHLAWGGLPNYRSAHHLEQELPAQTAFLSALVAAGLPRLLVTGTCFEYGMQSGALAETLPAQPDNPYGIAKDRLRRALQALRATHPFALTWARLFYLHGEGQAPNSLWPQLKAAAARGEALFDMSGGAQLRDYLPVTEAARLLVALALAGCDHGVVNVCSGRPVAVRALVEGWIAENGWSIRPNLGRFPYPDYEPFEFWGDASRLRRCLGEPSS